MMIGIIRMRGVVNTEPKIRTAFRILGLNRNLTLALTEPSADIKGVINTVKDYVTWGEVSKDVIKKLEELGSKGDKIKRFRLHPPRGGFKKTIKRPKPDGELGYRGEKINELILKMLP
ncbi:MAG: hypothetical protein GOU98_00755 [Candidatus Altiarchaeota archaeon]|nr:hypothetical protein [Candidatus Altiarchaeota archaeon]